MKIRILPLLAASMVLALSIPAPAEQPVYDGSNSPEMLWVQSASSLNYADGILTLRGVSATAYFSDRPYRLYGHMDNKEFADSVVAGQEADPPNAALAVLGDEKTIIVELLDKPEISDQGHTVSWKVRILHGEIPGQAGASSLFIDPMCQPQITD